MNPDLIALVLTLPLPVRLALLDADPTGAGWYVFAVTGGHHATLQQVASDAMPGSIKAGAAWLPCNPLAIVEHARGMFGETAFPRVTRVGGKWRMTLMRDDGGDNFVSKKGEHECPHTAAVALLR